ncbi:MAG TPA: flavoprotein [Pseudonocardiaceae bacterium]
MKPRIPRLVGLVASGAGGVDGRLRRELVEPALARGWQPAVVFTPVAATWFEATGELGKIQAVCELPVRWEPRLPGQAKPYPLPEGFLFVPATANSLAKLALGIADNQALSNLGEALGARLPLVVRPQAGQAQRDHPAFAGHLATLAAAGVRIADGPAEDDWEPLLDVLDELLPEGPR